MFFVSTQMYRLDSYAVKHFVSVHVELMNSAGNILGVSTSNNHMTHKPNSVFIYFIFTFWG